MTYEAALAFIHDTYKFGSKLGLDNIKLLMSRLGDPQKKLKFVHIAGTNGKGSTSAFTHSVLVEAGYRVGLYTSPFIETFNERMRVNHTLISESALAKHTEKVKEQIDEMVKEGYNHPTEFEVVTAIAMLYFLDEACDVVVLEVGLGGRLDATNVIDTPLVSVITPLALDHIEYLGDTIELIAYEKSGIIKSNGTTVSYPQMESALSVISEKCQNENNDLVITDLNQLAITKSTFGALEMTYKGQPYSLSLFAPYQAQNAAMAIEIIDVLKRKYGFSISEVQLSEGLRKAKWIGRLEIISSDPFVIIDGAHNLHGILGLVESLKMLKGDLDVVGIVGILKDKDVLGMLDEITPYLKGVVTTKPDNPRALNESALSDAFREHGTPVLYENESIKACVDWVLEHAKPNTLYLGFGSLYMIGEIRSKFHH
ncbi:MAG: hypothetical protein BGO41_09070 [Clostridiales bacterium 38-18]|nr:MAG: hypothetical protein BGO41_09070 [Clostridiales bacterium 38-18]